MGPTLSLVRAQSERAFGPVWALAGHTGHARAKPVRAPAGAAIWAGPGTRDLCEATVGPGSALAEI